MQTTERIEEQVRRYGGPYADEIIHAVRELAEVDVGIKKDLDEIERLDGELVRRHNELADRINELVKNAAAETDEEDESAARVWRIRTEVRVTGPGGLLSRSAGEAPEGAFPSGA